MLGSCKVVICGMSSGSRQLSGELDGADVATPRSHDTKRTETSQRRLLQPRVQLRLVSIGRKAARPSLGASRAAIWRRYAPSASAALS